ncbi:glycosyltransferase family 69 protein [Chaetomium sp. MPI-CAGE-AT-0009]|nr:glycosyltransferase family 69 protein [Chaetomium sp. MPI-CAGE-AT-0009]
MSRRRLITFAQVAALSLTSLYVLFHIRFSAGPLTPVQSVDLGSYAISPNAILTRENLTAYVQAILDPSLNPDLPSLKCPSFNSSRHQYLQTDPSSSSSTDPSIRYFFALNLRDCLPILPRLLSSVLEAIRFLGPSHCALSIVEGNSPDGTAEVLAALEPTLAALGIRTHFTLNHPTDPLATTSDRFSALAQLRNLALLPLTTHPSHYHPNATVLFINDVSPCADDLLELAHQRRHQHADMACAMDYTGSTDPIFYDVYVARAANGDLFFDVPPDTVSWAHASELFWNEPVARARFGGGRLEPFQVFACWNGAVAFTARPVAAGKVAFRGARRERGECHQGEPQLFCKDLLFEGYGRVMVVPSVSLGYGEEEGAAVKRAKGFTAALVARETGAETGVEWMPPPDMVKCMPTFNDQSWRPWNETLV